MDKQEFALKLKDFARSLSEYIIDEDNIWKIKGFIDSERNVYSISSDTKIVSKIIEIQIFPLIAKFADANGFNLVLAECQNWYPDISLVYKKDSKIKFAVDIKTTYKDDEKPDQCNGFTLGSHGEYFTNRSSTKNIQFPYAEYSGHFCLGLIYSRNITDKNDELKVYSLDNIDDIVSVIRDFTFFAEEKWKIASDKGGSGNTANIGSIKNISDILNGNGVFAKAGENIFDDYWCNFGKIEITVRNKKDNSLRKKKISNLKEYLAYRNLPESLLNDK